MKAAAQPAAGTTGGSLTISGAELGLAMLLHVSRVRSHAANRVAWHSHDGFELIFLLNGAVTYEFAGPQTVELHGGQFLVIPPGLAHRGRDDVRSPSTICGLAFRPSPTGGWKNTSFTPGNVARLCATLREARCATHPFNPSLRWLVRRLMEQTAKYPASPNRAEAAAGLRALICAVLVEARSQALLPAVKPKEFAAALITYLHGHFREPVRVPDLVRYLGFSRARMFDLFKSQTGLTPHDYLQRLRVEAAQAQLQQTRLSITEIALATGFSSLQHFSTVFARYTGLPPSTFRHQGGLRSEAPPAAGLPARERP